eukprot:SAG11_NODE_13436_length_655_cov_1.068345_1_plen_73_part_00
MFIKIEKIIYHIIKTKKLVGSRQKYTIREAPIHTTDHLDRYLCYAELIDCSWAVVRGFLNGTSYRVSLILVR